MVQDVEIIGRHDDMREDVCEHCAFSVFKETGHLGECRANPPTVVVVPHQQKRTDLITGQEVVEVVPMVNGIFPPVERRTFCHTFEDRSDLIGD